jgi:hypothetical protein
VKRKLLLRWLVQWCGVKRESLSKLDGPAVQYH